MTTTQTGPTAISQPSTEPQLQPPSQASLRSQYQASRPGRAGGASRNRRRKYLSDTRILSVQSHVVSGYVGNRAATFPLQLLGYDVDVVNTVQFSNHTGYGHTNGHKTTPEQLEAVFSGLEVNGLGRWRRILTGYIPGASALQVVADQVRKLNARVDIHNKGSGVSQRQAQAQASSGLGISTSTGSDKVDERGADVDSDLVQEEKTVYLLDPVMGDIGKGLYVAEDVVPIYRQMLSLATIITPNQFETELLAETNIESLQDLHAALKTLHSAPYSVPNVAISSIPMRSSIIAELDLPEPPAAYLHLLEEVTVPNETISAEESARVDAKLSQGVQEGLEGAQSGREDPMVLVCFASTMRISPETNEQELETYAFALPTIEGYFSGVGDLFSALVLGFYEQPERLSNLVQSTSGPLFEITAGARLAVQALPPFPKAVSKALLGVQNILLKTHQSSVSKRPVGGDEDEDEDADCVPSDEELDSLPPTPASKGSLPIPARQARRMRRRELRLVQERDALLVAMLDGVGWPGRKVEWASIVNKTV